VARDRKSQKVMGNRNGFSFKDIQLANVIYECATGKSLHLHVEIICLQFTKLIECFVIT